MSIIGTVGGTIGGGDVGGTLAPQLGQHIISGNEASDNTNSNGFGLGATGPSLFAAIRN